MFIRIRFVYLRQRVPSRAVVSIIASYRLSTYSISPLAARMSGRLVFYRVTILVFIICFDLIMVTKDTG